MTQEQVAALLVEVQRLREFNAELLAVLEEISSWRQTVIPTGSAGAAVAHTLNSMADIADRALANARGKNQ